MNRTVINLFKPYLKVMRRYFKPSLVHKASASALILTMLVIAALMTLTLGMSRIVPRDYRDILDFESSLSAEHAAWSGVEQSLYMIHTNEQQNQFYEVSQSGNPSGSYTAVSGLDCLGTDRTLCSAFDRGVDLPQNQIPLKINDTSGNSILGSSDPSLAYSLDVFHKHADVGNPGDPTLNDYLSDPMGSGAAAVASQNSGYSANINPVLNRDEVRRLDIRGVSNVTINWKPISRPDCDVSSGNTIYYLVVSVYDNANNLQNRWVTPHIGNLTIGGSWPTSPATLNVNGNYTMSLRFLVSVPPNQNDSSIAGCFMRYSIKNTGIETTDLGFDVINSIGTSGKVQRKIQVKANRENGRPLSIFDFGIACQTCDNIR